MALNIGSSSAGMFLGADLVRRLYMGDSLIYNSVPLWLDADAKWQIDFDPTEQAFISEEEYAGTAALIASANSTFSRSASGLYQNLDGSYTSFSGGSVRVGNKGLLIEGSALAKGTYTNTASAVTGVIGSGGALPTGWTQTATTQGVAVEVMGTGTENGLPYIEIRFSGTGSGSWRIRPMGAGSAGASVSASTQYATSWFLRLISGSVSGLRMGPLWYTSGGAFISAGLQNITPTSTFTRFSNVATSPGTAAFAHMELFSPSGSVDFTLRFYVPNLVQDSKVTSPILSVGSDLIRDADVFTLFPSHDFYDVDFTFDNDSSQVIGNQQILGSGFQIPTNLNRSYIKSVKGLILPSGFSSGFSDGFH